MWNQDQSPLEDYQPAGWTAKPDFVYQYLPDDIAKIWDVEKVQGDVIIEIDDKEYILIAHNVRAHTWGKFRTTIKVDAISTIKISLWQKNEQQNTKLDVITLAKIPSTKAKSIDILWDWHLGYDKKLDIRLAYVDIIEKFFWKNQFVQQLKSYQIE